MTLESQTTKLILTKEEIGECRQRILFSDAEIEVHIINALCDMALQRLHDGISALNRMKEKIDDRTRP